MDSHQTQRSRSLPAQIAKNKESECAKIKIDAPQPQSNIRKKFRIQTSHRFSIFILFDSSRRDKTNGLFKFCRPQLVRSYVINTEMRFLGFFLFLIFFSQKFIIYSFWAQFSKDLLISDRLV